MNPYMRNLNRLEFVVTYACTGRCKHCRRVRMTTPAYGSARSLRRRRCATRRAHMRASVMTGGEPLAALETVFAIHEAAARRAFPSGSSSPTAFLRKAGASENRPPFGAVRRE
ncbi:MAG: hypothetical protein ACLUFV_00165 [Acutalibacteraceae bacterium]